MIHIPVQLVPLCDFSIIAYTIEQFRRFLAHEIEQFMCFLAGKIEQFRCFEYT